MECAANDGASPNRTFFRFHAKLAVDLECDVVYKTENLLAMSRFIYFLLIRHISSKLHGAACITQDLFHTAVTC